MEQRKHERPTVVVVLSHISAYWLPTRKKLLYTVANPARGLLNRENITTLKSLAAHLPPTPHAARSEKNQNHATHLQALRRSRSVSRPHKDDCVYRISRDGTVNATPPQQRVEEGGGGPGVQKLPAGRECMYVCMYVWSSHIAEYGSTG